MPIRARGKAVGPIQLNDRRMGFFTLAVIEQLKEVAAHIGEALVRKQFEEDLARIAPHDPSRGRSTAMPSMSSSNETPAARSGTSTPSAC